MSAKPATVDKETIITLITGAEQGRVFDKANEQLEELISSCAKLQGKGKLVITIDAAVIKGKDAMQVGVTTEVKPPKPPAMTRPYFIRGDDALSRKHGDQPSLPISDVDPETGEILDDDVLDDDRPVADNITTLKPNA